MNSALNLLDIGHAHLQGEGTAAHRLDFSDQASIPNNVPQAQCDVCASMGQRQRDRPAEAASRPCHQGYLTSEVETGKLIHPVQDTPPKPNPGLNDYRESQTPLDWGGWP
jgi:hypothetical protein